VTLGSNADIDDDGELDVSVPSTCGVVVAVDGVGVAVVAADGVAGVGVVVAQSIDTVVPWMTGWASSPIDSDVDVEIDDDAVATSGSTVGSAETTAKGGVSCAFVLLVTAALVTATLDVIGDRVLLVVCMGSCGSSDTKMTSLSLVVFLILTPASG
jgi:hypothetical protein